MDRHKIVSLLHDRGWRLKWYHGTTAYLDKDGDEIEAREGEIVLRRASVYSVATAHDVDVALRKEATP